MTYPHRCCRLGKMPRLSNPGRLDNIRVERSLTLELAAQVTSTNIQTPTRLIAQQNCKIQPLSIEACPTGITCNAVPSFTQQCCWYLS